MFSKTALIRFPLVWTSINPDSWVIICINNNYQTIAIKYVVDSNNKTYVHITKIWGIGLG